MRPSRAAAGRSRGGGGGGGVGMRVAEYCWIRADLFGFAGEGREMGREEGAGPTFGLLRLGYGLFSREEGKGRTGLGWIKAGHLNIRKSS